MQRVFVIKPPYGTTIRSLHNSSDLWLMYDSSQEEVLVEWLRAQLWEHEAKLQAEARDTVAPPVHVNIAETALQAVKAMPVKGQHDWSGPYVLGAKCAKCGTTADGLEKGCSK